MIGLGSQDSLSLARDFIDRTGTKSFPMVWEQSGSTWRHYGIRLNSETCLLDKNGNRIGTKMYSLDGKAAILEAIK